MWLTLHFSWSVYFSIYNNVHPRHGPRLPPHITRHDACYTHHVLRCTQTHRHATPTHEKLQQIQWLSQLRQLLWNQLPLFRVYFPEGFVITVYVATADYIFIPYPYRVVWLLLWSQEPSNIGQCLPRIRARVSHTSFGIEDTCNRTWNGRGRGSRVRNSFTILLYYSSYIDSYYTHC